MLVSRKVIRRAARPLLLPALAAAALGTALAGEGRLAPVPPAEALSTHGPFEMGDCATCHQPKGPRPGALLKPLNDLCFDCHEDFKGAEVARHPPAKGRCTLCHSPHNARKKKLLL